MYIADELLPDIMLSLCKNLGSIEYKAPGFIMKLCSKRRNKKAFNPHHLPPDNPGIDFQISTILTEIVLLIHANRAIPTIECVLSTSFFT
jgi:hypothetical protein